MSHKNGCIVTYQKYGALVVEFQLIDDVTTNHQSLTVLYITIISYCGV